MINRIKPVIISEENKEAIEISEWAWNSHYWIESAPGYVKCKWCGADHTSEQPIDIEYPLCLKNPSVFALLRRMLLEVEACAKAVTDKYLMGDGGDA